MSLPPEQINIKRRRAEEPVEALYIQDAVTAKRPRFEEFYFQRVTVDSNGNPSGAGALTPTDPATQRILRTPRSVSSPLVNRRSTQSTGVPSVRATSPGAEFREAQRLAAVRKNYAEKRRQALESTPIHSSPPPTEASSITEPATPGNVSNSGISTPSSNRPENLRRFQITRSGPSGLSGLLGSPGIQKRRRFDGKSPIAVLMEKRQGPLSRKASVISDIVTQVEVEADTVDVAVEEKVEEKPRKRPVVNQAERKWRESRQAAIAEAKRQIDENLEKSAHAHNSTWDEESDRLAKEFEQVALEIERGNVIEDRMENQKQATPQLYHSSQPRKPLKYQPKAPKHRAAAQTQQPIHESQVESPDVEMESDYVYDVYIRRPIAEMGMLTNPLSELESENHLKSLQAANSGIGVIVITPEDEDYWEHFVEGDEEEWDSEDADSNAENNPANDYPEDEMSSEDEDDDPTAIYSKYRNRGASDDEEYNFDDSDSDGGNRYGQWRHGGGYVHSDDEDDW
ncbi:hypothetical protein N7468_002590 [Penicillium chermesinum]|uniref:Transcription factor Iwr1 domain-containing protein n=1 Tax=Penicillium chermesinum TaxID=63820 RepID=A0A9W9PK80_9EURO|nr:uncharacterized protein N7468_002590 [Penicillium chermesinum]KAJ5247607.1 hypothetical protein N7468_002590 [Penicillium chermesinum]KAJ6145845.1 hypothetical protein N7470_009740 [Penicillium chermesinum]